MIYLALDTELTGLDPLVNHLLTASFLAFDGEGKYIDGLNLALCPNGPRGRGNYTVCAEAMGVNKIDLIKHDKTAITFDEGRELLRKFLKSLAEVKVGTEKKNLGKGYPGTGAADRIVEIPVIEIQHLIPLGHNIAGDIRFIKTQLYPEWEHYVSYRVIDTVGIARFLIDCGILKTKDNKGSLEAITKAFNILYEAHTAEGDAMATAQAYFKMKELMTNASQTNS